MTTFYLIRHGNTEGNAAGLFQGGGTEGTLSELGKAQIERLSEHCRDMQFDRIYASPMLRAWQTALAAARYHPVDIVPEEDLREINGGLWEALSIEDIAVKWPVERQIWGTTPHLSELPGGESVKDVYDRVVALLDRLCHLHDGQSIALVCHGVVIRTAIAHAEGSLEKICLPLEGPNNATITKIEWEPGNVRLIFKGDQSHLQGL